MAGARLWIAPLMVCLGGWVSAQSRAHTADLLGVVRDPRGLAVPGAVVTASHLATNLSKSSPTDEAGRYRIAALVPGEYGVRVECGGFDSQMVSGVELTVGQYANLDFHLDFATALFSVTVEGRTDILEPEKTVQASTIGSVDINNLPINGRQFLDFALLTPGVATENSLDNSTPTNTPTSGLSFSGQDPRSNYVTIDGVDNMDVAVQAVRPTLSQEAVQEFQISRSNFSAEFGRSRGGVINIVSKSGGNDFQGSAFLFLRNEALDARNPFASQDPEAGDPTFRRYQFGGTVGGPIAADRTFLFASYEGLVRRESVFVTFLDDTRIFGLTPSQTELFGALAGSGDPQAEAVAAIFADPRTGILNTTAETFPGTISLLEKESGVFPFQSDAHLFSFKLDHNFTDKNSAFARFNFSDSRDANSQFGGLKGVSNGVAIDSRNYSAVFSDSHAFSPTKLNEFRFQHSFRRFQVPTNDPLGPELLINGVAQLGRDFTNPTGYDLTGFQFLDNFTLIRGRHTLKLGVDLNRVRVDGFAELFLGGQFSFAEAIPLSLVLDGVTGPGTTDALSSLLSDQLGNPSLASNLYDPITSLQSFNLALPVTYFQGFGNARSAYPVLQTALFLQDEWRVRDSLTLNLGVRWDWEDQAGRTTLLSAQAPFELGERAPRDNNNFAPRIGFAYNRGRYLVRGGYGIFYQPLFQSLAFTSRVLGGQISQVFLPLTGLPGVNGTSADVYGAYLASGRLDESTLDGLGIGLGVTPAVLFPSAGDLVNPYSHQASLGVETRLGRDLSLSVDYILNRGVHLVRIRDANVNQVGPDTFVLPGRDPRFLQLDLIETSGGSIHHGLAVALKKRYSSGFSMLVSYTLGKSIDDIADFTVPLEPHNHADLRLQRGLSTFDQRHRLVASAVFVSPLKTSANQSILHNLAADWTLAPILTWQSGRPFTLFLGFDANGDGHAESDRPRLQNGDLVGRNTGKGPSFFSADFRLARRVDFSDGKQHLEILLEAFNLLNNVNYSGVNNFVGTLPLASSTLQGNAGLPPNQPLGFTSAFGARQLQLGLRFFF